MQTNLTVLSSRASAGDENASCTDLGTRLVAEIGDINLQLVT